MHLFAEHQSGSIDDDISIARVLRTYGIENQGVAFPFSDGVARIGRPHIFSRGMSASVGVNSENVRTVLAENPDLLGSDDELVNIGEIHDSGKTVRGSTRINGIG